MAGFALLMASLLASPVLSQPCGFVWSSANTLLDARLQAVATSGDVRVATTLDGALLSSTDRGPWIREDVAPGFRLVDVATDGQNFVVVAADQHELSGRILQGRPGSWTLALDTAQTVFQAVVRGDGLFLASGRGAFIDGVDPCLWSSTDGSTWSPVDLSAHNTVGGFPYLAYTQGSYMLFKVSSGVALQSEDGVSFRETILPFYGELVGAAALDGTWAICVHLPGASNVVWTSPDGVYWSPHALRSDEFFHRVRAVGGRFVVLGMNLATSYTEAVVYFSTAVGPWDRVVLCNCGWLRDVTWDSDGFTGVSDLAQVMVSLDGQSWTEEESCEVGTCLYALASDGHGRVLAGGASGVGHGELLLNESGSAWRAVADDLTCRFVVSGLAYGDGRFVALLNDRFYGIRTFALSEDAQTWTLSSFSLPPPDSLGGKMAWGGGVWVYVAYGGKIWISGDGLYWEPRDSGTTADLLDVAYGAGAFVVTASDGTILWSENGDQWTHVLVSSTSGMRQVVYGNGLFVASAPNGRLFTSATGLVWSSIMATPLRQIECLAAGHGQFLASMGTVTASSTDLQNWVLQGNPPGTNHIITIAVEPDGFVGAGANSGLFRTTCRPLQPYIAQITAVASPYRLMVEGYGFQPDARAWVNGWPVTSIKWKTDRIIFLKKGRALKDAVRSARPAIVRVENPDGRGHAFEWNW